MGGFGKKGGKGRTLGDGEKARNVEFILYDDGIVLPKDAVGNPMVNVHGRLVSFLDSAGLKCALSPVHDLDVYDLEDVIAYRARYAKRHGLKATAEEVIINSPDVGTPKEPHRHLHCYASGPRTLDWWLDWISPLCETYPAWRVWYIERPDTATRYLAHLDSEDKPHYPATAVEGFGGMDLSPLWHSDEIQTMHADVDIKSAIQSEGIRYYNQLYDWACETGDYNIMRNVKGAHSFWCQYLGGRLAIRNENMKRKSMRGGNGSVGAKSEGNVEDMIG